MLSLTGEGGGGGRGKGEIYFPVEVHRTLTEGLWLSSTSDRLTLKILVAFISQKGTIIMP